MSSENTSGSDMILSIVVNFNNTPNFHKFLRHSFVQLILKFLEYLGDGIYFIISIMSQFSFDLYNFQCLNCDTNSSSD